jgi:hypothetical protein
MHSYLVTNAKTELKFLNEGITSEELNETFNKIALAIDNGDDLFNEDDSNDFSFEDLFKEIETLEVEIENNNDLEIINFIDLETSVLLDDDNINNIQDDEESTIMIHGDRNFDIDELINNFQDF